MPQKTQTFNDGVANIYKIDNTAEPGNMPKEGLLLRVGEVRYKERTVGMGRFWSAMQTQAKVERLLRMPRIIGVSTHDIIIPIDGSQYEIVQVQYPEDVFPPVMDLSLERVSAAYDIAGT